MMSWIFRYLTVMFYGWLYSGLSTLLHVESVKKLNPGTAVQIPGALSQCHDPPRQLGKTLPIVLLNT
jgi:hypothetical protein